MIVAVPPDWIMRRRRPAASICAGLLVALAAWSPLQARTVYRCVLDGTVSLATAPDPGAQCEAHELDDDDPNPPALWGALGEFRGALFVREEAGRKVYSTRPMDGAERVLDFHARTAPGADAHPGLGIVGPAQLDRFDAEFRAAARAYRLDEAWLRAIAHAESAFDPLAVSEKGALGVMQLMPEVVREYGIDDPFDPAASIDAGARHLRFLTDRLDGDLDRIAAAYNAGIGAVALHGGIPPYPETRLYVARVHVLHARYRAALGLPAPASALRAAGPQSP